MAIMIALEVIPITGILCTDFGRGKIATEVITNEELSHSGDNSPISRYYSSYSFKSFLLDFISV